MTRAVRSRGYDALSPVYPATSAHALGARHAPFHVVPNTRKEAWVLQYQDGACLHNYTMRTTCRGSLLPLFGITAGFTYASYHQTRRNNRAKVPVISAKTSRWELKHHWQSPNSLTVERVPYSPPSIPVFLVAHLRQFLSAVLGGSDAQMFLSMDTGMILNTVSDNSRTFLVQCFVGSMKGRCRGLDTGRDM